MSRPANPGRKLAIAKAVCRRALVRAVAGRWYVRPNPASYPAIAEEFGVSVDRVSRLANDRALWAAAWALLLGDLSEGIDRNHREAIRRRVAATAGARARDGVILESEVRRDPRHRDKPYEASDLFMGSIDETLRAMVNAGELTNAEARRARQIVEQEIKPK